VRVPGRVEVSGRSSKQVIRDAALRLAAARGKTEVSFTESNDKDTLGILRIIVTETSRLQAGAQI
jgi:Mg-chelatase subunit ChlI